MLEYLDRPETGLPCKKMVTKYKFQKVKLIFILFINLPVSF